ncbi:hypothetical protein IKF02_03590 [Candidatus Saccharibacteria bacterium]|nr:hypothetical protein [Candidatus Saccharibacteria bacterium]MBR3143836.1 hypothetical protein [Candidatus Saccharibacteria bacterium]
MARSKKVKNFDHKGVTYVGSLRANKVTVRVERTARGQNCVVGIYDVTNKNWHNVKNLPKTAREYFEKIFTDSPD